MHEVIAKILSDNEWRAGDFARYKRIPQNVNEFMWCRMCIPMIYAHWEGFIVDAMRTLLKYLNTLELEPSSVPLKLLVLSLDNAYGSLSGKQSFSQRVNFTEKFKSIMDKKISFKLKIETKSNLNSKVLKDLCYKMEFDYARLSEMSEEIDTLVNIRNSVAHGENAILPDIQKIVDLISLVQKAMDIFLEEIETFLVQEKYLSS